MPRGGRQTLQTQTIVTYGGWYQRTTLHLSEVFAFLKNGDSRLPLDREKLTRLHNAMHLVEVERQSGLMDRVVAKTHEGIEIRFEEDGLFVLEMTGDVEVCARTLKEYFDNVYAPAISYIFSLGAPTPKTLANLPTTHPTVVTVLTAQPDRYVPDERMIGHVYQVIESNGIRVMKTSSHIVIVAAPKDAEDAHQLVELQIFFREFKDQLGKYLSIHRTLWEEIARIKERKSVKLSEAQKLRAELDGYQVTIDLIGNRINQMGTYVRTRASIAERSGVAAQMHALFQYRFEVLLDTLEYIKELWKMTRDYLSSAISVIKDVQQQSTKAGIKSLRAITTFGVLVALTKFTWESQGLQKVTSDGLLFLVLFLGIAWAVERATQMFTERADYKLKFVERSEKI